MNPSSNEPHKAFTVTRLLPPDASVAALRADARQGLDVAENAKALPPKWFYDDRGSELFEDITRLPEYYPTRAERQILTARSHDIAALTGARTLVELGSGSSEKTRLLIDALRKTGTLARYVPVDVSEAALRSASRALLDDYPGLTVHGLVADFQHLALDVPAADPPVLLAFLGGTLGNLLPSERSVFLASLTRAMRPGDALLLGTDLVKDEKTLVAAYDDSAGVTAAFNKNVLSVLNRELDADFDPSAFDHVAVWDSDREWIEMRLRSRRAQTAKIRDLDLIIPFAAGEDLRTEISAKFRREGIESELADAGLRLTHWWTDQDTRFALSLSTPT